MDMLTVAGMIFYFQRGHVAMHAARRLRDASAPSPHRRTDLPPAIAFPNSG